MFDRRLNSADTSRPSARHAVVLGVVLLVGVAVAGAALGGVTAAESQSSPVEISNWTDLQAINDSQATLNDDYVLVNDLNKSTAGYNAVVLNRTATEFTEEVYFDEGESRVNLTRTPVNKVISNDDGLNLAVVDSANGTIEREDTSSFSFADVTYATPTERFVGFNPIGEPSPSQPFAGSFDGQGHTIRDLLIDRPTDDGVGLFGSSQGTLNQVTVAHATITGSGLVGGLVGQNEGMVGNASASGAMNGSSFVGGLVGDNFGGTVSNSAASGTVTGTFDLGGLVGLNDGTVSNSSASGAVNGSSFVGGLVGDNSATVSNSSASGAVNGSGWVGGLVGSNGGPVNESFATGAVTGSSKVGGLVGAGKSAQRSYWDIQATGQSQSAGGTGLNTSQMQGASAAQNMAALDFTNTWRVVTDPPGYPELRGLPEPPLTAAFNITPENPTAGEQLTLNAAPSTPESDIDSYNWTLGDGTTATGKQINHTYTDFGQFTVELTVQNGTETDTATETVSVSAPSSPVEISDWTDLEYIRNNLDADYVLVNDLNKSTAGYNAVVLNRTATEFTEGVFFNEGESQVNLTRTPVAELLSNNKGLNLTVVDSANGTIERDNTSSFSDVAVTYATPTERFVGFSPVGPSFSERFTGSFDGQGNTIRDLLIDRPTDNRIGLFGVSEGIIEQVTLVNATITGGVSVGGLVGRNNGTMNYSSASGAVTGSNGVGGLVGFNRETVSNSSASGAVDGSAFVGGLFGANDGTVSNSSASGAVTGSSRVGGLVGSHFGRIVSNSSASGAVTGSSRVGGLVGVNDGTVSTSSASGAVTGSDSSVGGLVGSHFGGIVSNSSASGAVDGSDDVGGLVGSNFGGVVSNSSASGAVDGSDEVGGLVGFNRRTVSNSSASGDVNGSSRVGGLVGSNSRSIGPSSSPGTVSNSSASGAVNGSDDVGGLVGHNDGGTVSESFATGEVTGSTGAGGLVGRLGSQFLDPEDEVILRDSYYDTQTTEQQAAVGTIVEGNGTAELRGEVAGLPTSQMQGASAAQNMGALDFTNTWRVVTNPPGYPELRGLPDGPDPSLAAVFTITPANPTVGEQLTFDAGPSIPEGDIEGYNWTLGDGTTATGKQITHTYTNSGQFTVELTVQNGTETDTASETVTVNEPSSFDVTITSVNSTVTAGETIAASYEVTNTGGVQATQDIEFSVNGSVESTEAGVTLNGSETASGQFSYTTGSTDTPAVNATVASADDTAGANVTVLAPAVFTVDIVETTTPAEGETLNVTVGIENTGVVEGTQKVTLDVGALGTDSTSVTLDGGGSTTLTLGVGTDTGDAGGYTATVSSANATTSANVTVLTPAQFVVSNLTAPAETTVGTSITVSATVTNIGETDDPQTVAFRFDGQTVANRTVSLAPNASTTLTFTPTVPDQTGTFEHGVFTPDDNQTAEITVVDTEPPTVTLSSLRIADQGANATVLAGSYDVTVTVSHDGGPGGVVPVELTVGPTTITETITLNASETTTVTFENATSDLSPGSYDVTVSAGNASLTGEVTLSVPVGDNPDPATDTDDDSLLEDTDGDGSFTIFDVQTFFVEFQSDPVQTNSALFNFDGSGDGAVTIFDVQALFTDLAG